MMNVQRIEALIAYLEELPAGQFDMGEWWEEQYDDDVCGTVGCIAGHAVMMSARTYGAVREHQEIDDEDLIYLDYEEGAIWLLGLDPEVAQTLFGLDQKYGRAMLYHPPPDFRCRPHHAAAALRNVLRYGEPRWHDALRAKPQPLSPKLDKAA